MTAPDPRVVLTPWSVVRGDAFTNTVTFRKTASDGTITTLDLTTFGTTWRAQLRGGPDYTTFVPFTINQTNAATGVLVFTLTSAQTASLALPSYQFDLEVSGGSVSPQTPFRGTLTVYKDDTQ